MATSGPTLFTLPPHLRANIAALVEAHVLPSTLQDQLVEALAAADIEEMEETVPQELLETKPLEKQEEECLSKDASGTGEEQGQGDGEGGGAQPTPQRKPPTIDGDILDAVSVWAAKDHEKLAKTGLDPANYSFIGLLAGTQVYLPPLQRKLAAAADKALADKEKANPYLPTYLSPTPPSLGSEYRQLSRQVATVLNILFSVFGVAGGVYVVAKNAGWTREGAILLGILGGVVVGIADSVLVWIFKTRVKKDQKATARRRVRLNKGSAAIPGSARVLTAGEDGEALVLEEGEEATQENGEGGEGTTTATEKRTLRLRRKPLGEE